MSSFEDMVLRLVEDHNSLAGLAVLASSATIEYVFPPFPGDFVTVLGAILVTAYGWSVFAVLGAVMLGSMVGAMIAFQVGVFLARRRSRPRPLIDRIIARFQRHGAAYVMINRFLPGIRGLVFVAAGMAQMPRGKVLLYASISALAWNALLMGIGAALGANLDGLVSIVRNYTLAVWVLLIGITVVVLGLRWWRRSRSGGDTHPK